MENRPSAENEFIEKVTGIIESNLSDEHFGVPQLASELGISRSTLHRKINSVAKLSATQFIRHIRLKHAREMLRQTSLTVSEAAYKSGFSSPVYFSKCFHDYFGYPPVKVGNRDEDESEIMAATQLRKKRLLAFLIPIIAVGLLGAVLIVTFKPFSSGQNNPEKSIAIIPPILVGHDSTYQAQLDGTVMMIIDHLSKISRLKKVIPWISVQQYRDKTKTATEIAKEQDVSYIVTTDGMALEDSIRLNVRIINGITGSQVWWKPYEVDAGKFIKLPMDIAREIAGEINAEITPEELVRIEKLPTDSKNAWTYYLKGSELLNNQQFELSFTRLGPQEIQELNDAVNYFRKALEYDDKFALVYAELARTYFYLDFEQDEKKYLHQIERNAIKAMSVDPQLVMSNIAIALHYRHHEIYEDAIEWLEKALKFNPNSYMAIAHLRNIYRYTDNLPNSEKYLEYALMANKLNIISPDSNIISNDFLHLGIAFRQAGFIDEAIKYIDKALEMNPDNSRASFDKITFRKLGMNFQQKIHVMLQHFNKDSTNDETLRALFLLFFNNREYESALKFHYKRLRIGSFGDWDAGKVGLILSKLGKKELAEEYFKKSFRYSENLKTIYSSYSLSATYSSMGDTLNAIQQMKIFSKKEYFHDWVISSYKVSPSFDDIRNLPEFQRILSEIESRFRENHERIAANLKEKGLF